MDVNNSSVGRRQRGCLTLIALFVVFVVVVSQFVLAPMVLNTAGATSNVVGQVAGGLLDKAQEVNVQQVVTASEPLVRLFLLFFTGLFTFVLGFIGMTFFVMFWPKKTGRRDLL